MRPYNGKPLAKIIFDGNLSISESYEIACKYGTRKFDGGITRMIFSDGSELAFCAPRPELRWMYYELEKRVEDDRTVKV